MSCGPDNWIKFDDGFGWLSEHYRTKNGKSSLLYRDQIDAHLLCKCRTDQLCSYIEVKDIWFIGEGI